MTDRTSCKMAVTQRDVNQEMHIHTEIENWMNDIDGAKVTMETDES